MTIRVNVRSVANAALAREEVRNGRKKIIVPSVTLPDDVVMNGIKYPADEIAASFKSLENTPAPLSHPMIGNKFLSASDTEAFIRNGIGAVNENVRRENGRVYLDKVIDVEYANSREGGRAVLAAIEQGEAIHTSTGLFCDLEDAPEGAEYNSIARGIFFDHDAILLDEDGAATPEDGVGIFVNETNQQQEIQVVNSAIEWAERDLEWALESAIGAVERIERASMIDAFKSAFIDLFKAGREPQSAEKDAEMAVTEKQFEDLSAKVNGLAENMESIGETIANAIGEAVKPLTDNLAEMQANSKAKDEAERSDLVNKIVKANLMSEEAANELTLNAARDLAKKAEPGKAAPLNSAPNGGAANDEFADYDLNANMKDAS